MTFVRRFGSGALGLVSIVGIFDMARQVVDGRLCEHDAGGGDESRLSNADMKA